MAGAELAQMALEMWIMGKADSFTCFVAGTMALRTGVPAGMHSPVGGDATGGEVEAASGSDWQTLWAWADEHNRLLISVCVLVALGASSYAVVWWRRRAGREALVDAALADEAGLHTSRDSEQDADQDWLAELPARFRTRRLGSDAV